MEKMFISDTDYENKFEFEYEPEADLFPNFDVEKKEYWSIPGWDDDTGDPTHSIYTMVNWGGSEVGGTINLSFNYMSMADYKVLREKYKSGADQIFRRYYSDTAYADYRVSISQFPQEKIPGVKGIQWKIELKVLEVIEEHG